MYVSRIESSSRLYPARPLAPPFRRAAAAIRDDGVICARLTRARDLHELLLRARLQRPHFTAHFLETFLAIELSRLYELLGFASLAHYARVHFGCTYFETQRLLQVARSLGFLPALREMCQRDALPWEKVIVVASIARPHDEDVWIERAQSLPVNELREAARRHVREAPHAYDAWRRPLSTGEWWQGELPPALFA